MTKILTSLLVGAHFRPPAKTLLAHLPSGCPLLLQPEPGNQYDPDALQVLLDPADIPASQHPQLSAELPLQGATLEQVLSAGPIHLGFVAKSGGKPLLKAIADSGGQLQLVGNAEFHQHLAAEPELNEAKLGFGPGGESLVHLLVDEPEEGEIEGELEDEEGEE